MKDEWTYNDDPESTGRYIVAVTTTGVPFIAYWNGDDWSEEGNWDYVIQNVYAWIPLPEMPPILEEIKP